MNKIVTEENLFGEMEVSYPRNQEVVEGLWELLNDLDKRWEFLEEYNLEERTTLVFKRKHGGPSEDD